MHESIHSQRRFSGGRRSSRAVGTGDLALQFAFPHFEHLGRAIQDLATQICALCRPSTKGCSRRYYRVAKILFRGPTKIRQHAALRVERRKHAAIFATHKFSADVKLVSLLNLETRLCFAHEPKDCAKQEKRKC